MTASAHDVSLHHIDAGHVRSDFDTMEGGVTDAPEPDAPVRILAMTAGPRRRTRMGGPKTADSIHRNGQR